MSGPLLSVIIPTIGRPTLERALRSIRLQAPAREVELLVVGDTYDDTFTSALAGVPPLCGDYQARYLAHDGGRHMVGQDQRNAGMAQARGTWLMWGQDDSIWARTAWATIRAAMAGPPGPRICQVDVQWRFLAWSVPDRLQLGNLDADGLLVPNLPARLGHFGNRYEGDYDFAVETVALWRGRCAWVPGVVAIARPDPARDWVTAAVLGVSQHVG